MEQRWEEIIAEEYPQLKDIVYADYAGAMVMSKSQAKEMEILAKNCDANPHSGHQVSRPVNDMEDLRSIVCHTMGTTPGEYAVAFTHNTTHSIQILAELFSFDSDTLLDYLVDNHNSVFGMRIHAENNGATVNVTETFPADSDKKKKLFAFPMQSNLSGRKYPLEWISQYQAKGGMVLLDGASSTAPILSVYKPDFCVVSLLKLSGAHGGAMLVRRDRLALLNDPLPAGGTLLFSGAKSGKYIFLKTFSEKNEGGTAAYLDLSLSVIGFKVRERFGTETDITEHINKCATKFYEGLVGLKHTNGKPLVVFAPEWQQGFGGTFSFNMFKDNDQIIPHNDVQYCFSVNKVVARFGGHCNPGAGFSALGWDDNEVEGVAIQNQNRGKCVSNLCAIGGKPIGTIRISFGVTTTLHDVDRLLDLLSKQFLNGGPCPPPPPLVTPLKIEKMYVFPVMGTYGFEVDKWTVSDNGLIYDRGWKLVNAEGATATTKACPRLLSIYSRVENNEYLILDSNGKQMKVKIEGFEEYENPPQAVAKQGIVYSKAVSEFLYEILHRYLYLVKVDNRDQGRLAFSAITLETVEALGNTMDPIRFRSNVFLSGSPAFSEETLITDQLYLNGIPLTTWRRRIICMTTSVEPETMDVDVEPLRKMNELRGRNGAVQIGVLFGIKCEGKTYPVEVGNTIQLQ